MAFSNTKIYGNTGSSFSNDIPLRTGHTDKLSNDSPDQCGLRESSQFISSRSLVFLKTSIVYIQTLKNRWKISQLRYPAIEYLQLI